MIHQFLQIGDIHLQSTHPRNVDRLKAFDQIITEGSALSNLAAWLLPGDLFHGKSSVSDRNDLTERLLRMAAAAPVCITYGNHCQPQDLDIFRALNSRWPIHVSAVPEVYGLNLATGHVATLFAFPWPCAAGLIARGVAQPDVPAAARQALEAIFIDAGQQLAVARARGEITLMIGHANVAGAVASTGQPPIGAEISLDGALLAHLGDCPKMLSHIHLAQDVAGAHYAGSVCRLDWGEISEKSFSLLTFQGNSWSIERRPIVVPPMWHCEAWLTRDGVTGLKATAGPEGALLEMPASWVGCEVRLRCRYKQNEGLVLADAQAQAKALFADARRFEFEPICVPDRAVRAPEVATAKTLVEKVIAWSKVTNVVLPETVTAKLGALEGTDADVLVAAEAARLDAIAKPDERLITATPLAAQGMLL